MRLYFFPATWLVCEPSTAQNWWHHYIMDPYLNTQLEIATFSLCDSCALNLVIENGCMPRESSLGEDWKNNSLGLHQPPWIEAPAEKEQQAIGQNYYFDRWDAALGQSFSYPAEMKRCECEDCNCFKNRLGFKNTGPQWEHGKKIRKFSEIHTPADSLFSHGHLPLKSQAGGGVSKAFCMVSAW